jgi:hypothetical protein
MSGKYEQKKRERKKSNYTMPWWSSIAINSFMKDSLLMRANVKALACSPRT